MSGHSKWATIKHKKAKEDSKRGKVFTKLIREITVAAREGGGDPMGNARLRLILEKARAANMPQDNITRAIKKGTGELGGAQVEELVYEGMGPCGVQVIVKSITDNKNRSGSTIRHCFTKSGGAFGSVMWNFSQKGVFMIGTDELKLKNINFEDLELELIDFGLDEFSYDDEFIYIYTPFQEYGIMQKTLEEKNIEIKATELQYLPTNYKEVTEEQRKEVNTLIEALEEDDDVQSVYHNMQ